MSRLEKDSRYTGIAKTKPHKKQARTACIIGFKTFEFILCPYSRLSEKQFCINIKRKNKVDAIKAHFPPGIW